MFSVIHTDGSGVENPALDTLSALYDELLTAEKEHGDVAVISDDTGWILSAHRDGRLVFEHLANGGERHMYPISKEQVLLFWQRLIEGDIGSLSLYGSSTRLSWWIPMRSRARGAPLSSVASARERWRRRQDVCVRKAASIDHAGVQAMLGSSGRPSYFLDAAVAS